jgi:hypothetical protein
MLLSIWIHCISNLMYFEYNLINIPSNIIKLKSLKSSYIILMIFDETTNGTQIATKSIHNLNNMFAFFSFLYFL